MKKYILAAAALLCGLFTGCTNDEIEIENYDQLTLNITTESMYEELGMLSSLKNQALRDGNYEIYVQTFVYDSDGNLYQEEAKYSSNSNPIAVTLNSVKRGTYTVVAVQTVVAVSNGRKPYSWEFGGKEKLSTLQINQLYNPNRGIFWYEALGTVTKTVTVNGAKSESIVPKAIGNVIQTYFYNYLGSSYLNVGVGTRENITAYRLDPSLAQNERVIKDLSSTGSFYLLGKKAVGDNPVNFTLYTIAETLKVCQSSQDETNNNTGTWYTGNDYSIDMTAGVRFYLGYYLTNDESTIYHQFANSSSDIQQWYYDRQSNDKSGKEAFSDPYLSWNSSVSSIQSYMSSYYSQYAMYSGESGQAEAVDWDSDGVADAYRLGYYNKDEVVTEITYYFTSATSGCFESYAFINYEDLSLSEIQKDIATKYPQREGDYYLSSDNKTIVAIWDQETYAAIEYMSYDYYKNASAKKAPLTSAGDFSQRNFKVIRNR